ncbi:hypothetical protein HPB50_006308 [Hyalomma asiaticum]|uniref:Uncharacterized protein n=1 Tax=Hyalomma asiaticum TaxID=266040 RepID=A0ACB7TCZ7_HYAAI|nr:hypothetical protein HPB50_006308 [Hyalomma asiaticum]
MVQGSRRPQPPHRWGGARPRRGTFYPGYQHQSPRFHYPMRGAYTRQYLGLQPTFHWTPGHALPPEPLPPYYVRNPPTALPLFPFWAVPAFSYGLARNQRRHWRPVPDPDFGRPTPLASSARFGRRQSRGRPPQAEQEAEVVRLPDHRAWTSASATRPSRQSPRRYTSREDQRLELVVLRLAEAAADLALNDPATDAQEEARRSGHRLVYSPEMLRSFNTLDRPSTPPSRSEHRIGRPLGSVTSFVPFRESSSDSPLRSSSSTPDGAARSNPLDQVVLGRLRRTTQPARVLRRRLTSARLSASSNTLRKLARLSFALSIPTRPRTRLRCQCSGWASGYTGKHGLGYQLCDNSVGVVFNDNTGPCHSAQQDSEDASPRECDNLVRLPCLGSWLRTR